MRPPRRPPGVTISRCALFAAVSAFALAALAFLMWKSPEGAQEGDLRFDISEDGKLVAISSWNGTLWILEPQRRKARQIEVGVGEVQSPVFIPGSKAVLFSAGSPEGKSLYAVNLEDGKVRRMTMQNSVEDRCGNVSPDGQSLLFIRASVRGPYSMGGYVWDDYDVFKLDLRKDAETRLTSEHYFLLLFGSSNKRSRRFFCAEKRETESKYHSLYRAPIRR